DGVLVQDRVALGDARAPGPLVARLRGAADAGAMARLAGLLIELVAVLRRGRPPGGARRGRGVDLPGWIVLAGHRDSREGLHPLADAFEIVPFHEHLPFLGFAGDDPRQGEQRERDRHQNSDNQAEYVEKVGVLLAHNAARAAGWAPGG